jgi:hypothetical protein
VSSSDAEIIRISAQLFHILINGEADSLLDSKLFTRSMLDLVCFATIGGSVIVEERLQTDLVELLFEIATKIRLDPDILPAWFYPDREATRGRNNADDSRRSQFPLFYVLVQYVHHDGPVGDFARTALLYLTETASRFKPLETWMIESDLAPQMASGLGALYSRLSRQSMALSGPMSTPAIVLLSDHAQNISSISEPPSDTQQDSKAFFTYLAFWQDTLNHCKSLEVSETLLDHFQVLFVQQLLYPSLLESSDVEGGSTAAVIDHLSRILRALHHLDLVDRILRYLLASPNLPRSSGDKSHRRQRMSVSRRKSVDHLRALAEVADSPSPNLFNLLDLMVMSLKSRHSGTVNACLNLLSVVIEYHHLHVRVNLFRLESISLSTHQRGVKHLNNALTRLVDYSATVANHADLDDSYKDALADGQVRLERHSCWRMEDVEEQEAGLRNSSISQDCKLFEALAGLLRSFFANDTITNLSLTQALLDLAACQHVTLQGWLLPLGDGPGLESSVINLTFILGELIEQVRQWRSQFPDWDQLVLARRTALDEDEPPARPQQPRALSGPLKEINTGARESSPSNSESHSRPTTPKRMSMAEFGSIDSTISRPGERRGSFVERALAHSPLRRGTSSRQQKEVAVEPELESMGGRASSVLRTQIDLTYTKAPEEASESLPMHAGRKQTSSPVGDRLLPPWRGGEDSGVATPVGGREETGTRTQASLNHILTNAVILQEFILELAAMVQLRATFFHEIDFGATVSD